MASKNVIQENEPATSGIVEQEKSEDITSETHMGELDKVRSILFGEQIQVYEEQMLQIEKDLRQNISVLSSGLNEQVEALDNRVKAQFDELLELVGKETHSREIQQETLVQEMEKISGELEGFKKTQVDKLDLLSDSIKTIMVGEIERMEQSFDEKMKAISDHFKQEFDKLEADTVSRSRFAELLTGLAQEIAPDNKSKK